MTKQPSPARTSHLDLDNRIAVAARRAWRGRPRVLLFISMTAVALLVNALFGERGLSEMLRARRAYAAQVHELAQLKQRNAAMRDQARRLRSDPATIESVARKDLGLVGPGEILVTVRDLKK